MKPHILLSMWLHNKIFLKVGLYMTISIENMKHDNMIKMNKFVQEILEKDKDLSKIYVTFRDLKWIDPSGAVIFLETIENLKCKNIEVEYEPIDGLKKAPIYYGINLGIFQKIGLLENDYFSEGPTYLAPTKESLSDVYTTIRKKSVGIETYFEEMAKKITEKVLKTDINEYDDGMIYIFRYVVRELIRNIFDHSKSEYFYYGSQYLPTATTVEFVISDRGLGLVNTIPFDVEEVWMEKNTTEEAIVKAFTPGITAASNHSYAHQDYLNSGFGLAIIKSIILKAEGVLSLSTSDTSITYKKKTTKIVKNCYIEGTLLRIRVDLEKLNLVNFDEQVALVMKEAEKIGTNNIPSKKSKSLF